MKYKGILCNLENVCVLSEHVEKEISTVIDEVAIDLDSGSVRPDLSEQFEATFQTHNWERDTNLHFEPARKGTLHFIKNEALAIITWRHYNTVGTELLKFQKDYVENRISIGIYICITSQLDEYLQAALEGKGEDTGFEGSITMEKAISYLNSVSEIITVPIAIMGLIPPN